MTQCAENPVQKYLICFIHTLHIYHLFHLIIINTKLFHQRYTLFEVTQRTEEVIQTVSAYIPYIHNEITNTYNKTNEE